MRTNHCVSRTFLLLDDEDEPQSSPITCYGPSTVGEPETLSSVAESKVTEKLNHPYPGMVGTDIRETTRCKKMTTNDSKEASPAFLKDTEHIDRVDTTPQQIKVPGNEETSERKNGCGTRYRQLFEHMRDAAFLVSAKSSTIIDANSKAETLLGKTRIQIIGADKNIISPELTTQREVLLNGISFESDNHESETEIIRDDGSSVPVVIHTSPFVFDGEKLLLKIVKNISREKDIQKKAMENETRFRLAFERSSEGMCLMGIDLKFLQANESLSKIFGYSTVELLSMTVSDITHPEDQGLSYRYAEKLLSGEKDNVSFEKRYIRKGGEIITAIVSISLVRSGDDEPLYFVSHINDITEEKKKEEDRVKHEMQLRQSQKLEAIGTLAGGIAHDFNNILTSVIGFSELVLTEVEPDSSIKSDLLEILNAGKRAKDLVNQILTFSREEEIQKGPVCLKGVVEECCKLLRSTIPTTIDVKLNLNSESYVMGDKVQFHQVIMNLCTNAHHAMQESGGTLSIGLKDVVLEEELVDSHPTLAAGSYVVLSIEDTGYGIPRDIVDNIFIPFFTTKGQNEGTGLGLSVVHGIVKEAQGEIFIHTEEAKGTRFSIYFPVIFETVCDAPEKPVDIPAGRERILLVDDEPALIKLGGRMLQSLGYNVTTSTSPIEALHLFKQNSESIDMVISDMTMPKISGSELIAQLKQINPNLLAILCTGFNPNIDEESCQVLGIDAMIKKPFMKTELGRIVRDVFDESRAASLSLS